MAAAAAATERRCVTRQRLQRAVRSVRCRSASHMSRSAEWSREEPAGAAVAAAPARGGPGGPRQPLRSPRTPAGRSPASQSPPGHYPGPGPWPGGPGRPSCWLAMALREAIKGLGCCRGCGSALGGHARSPHAVSCSPGAPCCFSRRRSSPIAGWSRPSAPSAPPQPSMTTHARAAGNSRLHRIAAIMASNIQVDAELIGTNRAAHAKSGSPAACWEPQSPAWQRIRMGRMLNSAWEGLAGQCRGPPLVAAAHRRPSPPPLAARWLMAFYVCTTCLSSIEGALGTC